MNEQNGGYSRGAVTIGSKTIDDKHAIENK